MAISQRLDLDQALQRILLDVVRPTAQEAVATGDALGRVLAETISAPIDLPPFDASAMDGFALRADDVAGGPPRTLTLAGTSLAGHPMTASIDAGQCARIFTGAPMPAGTDAVAIQEDCTLEGDRVRFEQPVRSGDHVRPVGHDVRRGTPLLERGRTLNAFDLGWLAASGIHTVSAYPRLTVAILSTGDELREPGMPLTPGAIFDANRTLLRTLLSPLPVDMVDLGIVPDSQERIAETLLQADRDADLVICSGGVSVGDADWVKRVVEDVGSLQLWRLNLKPGKPLAYGRLRRAAFFGLPGNPVSAVVTLLLVVRPVLEAMLGARPTAAPMTTAVLRTGLTHAPGREEYQRGTLRLVDGVSEVTVTGDQSSNRLASFAQANCLIRIPKAHGDLEAGTQVMVLPFYGLL